VAFARDLNSDLNVVRLSRRLVARIVETLLVDRMALMLAPAPTDASGEFKSIGDYGFPSAVPRLSRRSSMMTRLDAGHTEERVDRWNSALEDFYGIRRHDAVGKALIDIFDQPFVEALRAARQEHPYGARLYRAPLTDRTGNPGQRRLVNATAVPLRNPSGG